METKVNTKLESRIIARYGTLSKFADETEIPLSTVSRLLETGNWRASHMEKIVKSLKIPAKDIPSYFFTPKFPKM